MASRIVAATLIASVIWSGTAESQNNRKVKAKRSVSLDTVLSCPDDSLVREVFGTDWFTAAIKLSALAMALDENTKATDPEYIALQGKGFRTRMSGQKNIFVYPSESSEPKSFCRDNPTARYESITDKTAGPYIVQLDSEDWSLNPNEVLAHADQFKFESGVFSDSSDVYLTATKGRTSIQFLCKGDGLHFYRAFYAAP